MFISDLHHFLDLPEGTPGPARRMAEHLCDIVRAATAGDAGTAWESALTCRRRPANRPCPGRLIVLATEPAAPIRWRCKVCDDQGLISNWENSPFDLRRRRLSLVEAVHEVVISAQVAAALRELRLLDPDGERVVYRIRADVDGAILAATDNELDELIASVAAEANHEPNRPRRKRLDVAFDALTGAQTSPNLPPPRSRALGRRCRWPTWLRLTETSGPELLCRRCPSTPNCPRTSCCVSSPYRAQFWVAVTP